MKKIATVACCAPGAPPLKLKEFEHLSARFKALADPTRLAIVNRLASDGDSCVCDFASLGLSQPTISHHVKVLRGGAPQPEFVLATAEGTVAR
jgi:ArsR family transcriptional regulator